MNTMKRAWEIAKEGVKKFGGKVKEYFAEALRIAWAELKSERGSIQLPSKEGFKTLKLGEFEKHEEVIGEMSKKKMRDILRKGSVIIEKETEKAVMVRAEYKIKTISYRPNGSVRREQNDEIAITEWLPKSQIEVQEGYVFVKAWVADKKEIAGITF